MSKIIKISSDNCKQIYEEFLDSLRNMRVSDGRITFTKRFDTIKRRATLCFSEKAWLKMSALVEHYDKEVAWHATAYRDEDESKDIYYIDEIYIYPQEVTGATVTTDQDEYEKWLCDLPDEVFNNLRFQGHSHVYMGVTPSGTDTAFYDGILDGLDDDMFYIFMVVNKKGNRTIMIYDYKKNILFETADCDVEIEDGEIGLASFIEESDTMVKEKKYVAPKTPVSTTTNYGASSYTSQYGSTYISSSHDGHNSTYYNNNEKSMSSETVTANQQKTSVAAGNNKPTTQTATKDTPSPTSLVAGNQGREKKGGKRKGKRKDRTQKCRNLYEYNY